MLNFKSFTGMGKSADWIKEEKFKSFFTQYYKELYYFACGYVKDTCIVEDIVSESFVKLWANMENIQELAIRIYLLQTVKNACIDYLRVQKDFFPVEECHTLADLDENPLEYLISQEDESRITAAISELPQRYQETLKLRSFEKLKYSEIAQKMDISVNTVKSNLREAILILRKKLGILLIFIFFQI